MRWISPIILLLAFGLELGMLSFWRNNDFTGDGSAFVLFTVSVFIALYPLSLRGFAIPSKATPRRPWELPVLLSLTGLGLALCIPELASIFERVPVSAKHSDIVPQIDVMVRRFFHEGTSPYEVITEFGYKLYSPYMPLHWGPFVIARSFGFDLSV